MISSSDKTEWIKLPQTFINVIPLDQSEITSHAKVRQMKYLDRISGEISGNKGIIVDLLIIANFLKALEPLDVVPSQKDESYALKTALGWCFIWTYCHK